LPAGDTGLKKFITSICAYRDYVCVYVADTGEGDGLALGTAEEEVPVDTEFSEYVDIEGRTTDYTVASDADLLSDGLRSTELPGATALMSKYICYSHKCF